MEKKQDSLDYWLEEVQEKETYNFMYSKFLLTQMPLEVQEDEGMFAQVFNYGTKVLVSVVQHRHPETQCLRVIREAKRQAWKWKQELRDDLPHAVKEYEENLAECALCVAWGILYLELRDGPRTAFLNQMLRIWKKQWSCYRDILGHFVDGETRLDTMYDLVKKREKDTQQKKDTRKKEAAQEGNKSDNSQTMMDLQTRIEELEEQVKHYHDMEKGIALGLNQGQSSLLVKSMAKTFGFTYSNMKKDLAPLAHRMFGWGESKLAKYMSTPCEKQDRDELANLFKDVCPQLYRTIMNWGELPPEETPT